MTITDIYEIQAGGRRNGRDFKRDCRNFRKYPNLSKQLELEDGTEKDRYL